jgi:hypothetical protein
LRGLQVAERGVALFVRWQWLEGVERYERLFKPFPPTYVCPFAERVPLVKGRWDPDASTATSYSWIVWLRGPRFIKSPLVVHIPPGCRVSLTKPDDRERFA